MVRGFFKGVLWGAAFSVSGVALLSVSTKDRVEQDIAARLGLNTAPSESTQLDDARVEAESAPETGQPERSMLTPEPDTLTGLLPETLSPALVPEAGLVSGLRDAQVPQDRALNGIADPVRPAPQIEYSAGGELETPRVDPSLSISVDPMQPEQPEVMPDSGAFQALDEQPDVLTEQTAKADADTNGQPVAETRMDALSAPTIPGEIAMIPRDPAQPQVLRAPSGQKGQAPDLPTVPRQSSVAIESRRELTLSAPAPEVRSEAPVILRETVAAVTTAPRQPLTERADPGVPVRLTPDAQAALPSAARLLEALEIVSQTTVQGESASAQVSAVQSVKVPLSQTGADYAAANMLGDIQPAPRVQTTNPLPAVSELKAPLAPVIEETAEDRVVKPVPEPVVSAPVRVNRLPSLGDRVAPQESAQSEPPEITAESDPVMRPVEEYAASFEGTDGQPLFAVILMDDGAQHGSISHALSALQALPYSVSMAVDALLPDAAERMRIYRAAGFEVLATVDLPNAATAGDAEVNLSVALDEMVEIVGVLDGARTGVQTTPDAGKQVAQILSQTGHGFVLQNKGLNTVERQAQRAGVPSALVFRDFDGKGQSERVIRRFFDQAAFRAARDGYVVMLGRLRAETLAALALWARQDRSKTVTMAPVSAVLLSR